MITKKKFKKLPFLKKKINETTKHAFITSHFFEKQKEKKTTLPMPLPFTMT